MSDAYMTEFWAKAPWPWNELGPEMADRLCRGEDPPPLPEHKLTRWARRLREERAARGMTPTRVARAIGEDYNCVAKIERDEAGPGDRGWALLAAFYGIVLE